MTVPLAAEAVAGTEAGAAVGARGAGTAAAGRGTQAAAGGTRTPARRRPARRPPAKGRGDSSGGPPPTGPPDEPTSKTPRLRVELGSPAEQGAGFVLALLLWGWVGLPFLKGGPAEVKKVLMAKFFNKAPSGAYLP